jgi:hypothetical protein
MSKPREEMVEQEVLVEAQMEVGAEVVEQEVAAAL